MFNLSLHIPYSRITVWRDPHPSEVVGVDFVLYELTPPILMDIDSARLAVVDFTPNHGGVGSRLHLKPCYPIVVNVIFLKVTLKLKLIKVYKNYTFYSKKFLMHICNFSKSNFKLEIDNNFKDFIRIIHKNCVLKLTYFKTAGYMQYSTVNYTKTLELKETKIYNKMLIFITGILLYYM